MKKLKLVFLASLTALGAAAGTASAAIDSDGALNPTTGTGVGELFLSVIDRGGPVQRSYVLDLGITAADFLANDASLVNNLSFTADAGLLDILNNQSGTIAWNIAAAHNTFGDTFEDFGYLSTSPTALIANSNTPIGFNGVNISLTRIGTYLLAVDGVNTDYATDGSQIFPSTANAYYDTGWGDMWNGSHSTEGGLDSALGFYFVSMDFVDGAEDPTATSQVRTLLGEWSLSAQGLLTYTSDVGGAPVPVPAAFWLLGSALVGMAGIRRRKTTDRPAGDMQPVLA